MEGEKCPLTAATSEDLEALVKVATQAKGGIAGGYFTGVQRG